MASLSSIIKYLTFLTIKYYGVFTNYSEEGVKLSTLEYIDGKVNAIFYHNNGNKQAEGQYTNKLKENEWVFYDFNGILLSKEQYENGLLNGSSITFFKDGKVAQIDSLIHGKLNGIQIKYYEDGSIRVKAGYLNGEFEGTYREFYPDGKFKTAGEHVNGSQSGKWLFYNEDGTTNIRERYINGKADSTEYVNGEFQFFYKKSPDILKEVCRFKNGLKEGPYIEFYELGEWKYKTVTYENTATPQRPTEQVRYFDGEVIKSKGSYHLGKLHGEINYFDEKGVLVETVKYNNGTITN